MRVIAGSARRLLLKTVEGMDTRPTTDRIKETLFNILQPSLSDCLFLDLYSGSGAMGIEALSRGASHAYFVEKAPKAISCIKDNLETTNLAGSATVMACDVIAGLKKLQDQDKTFDIIFMDPPYDCGLEEDVLTFLAGSSLADQDTVIIVEASKGTDFSFLDKLPYTLIRSKEYKTNKHIFISKTE